MSFFDGIRYRLRALFRRTTYEQEFDEEFRFHLELEEAQQRHAGVPSSDAGFASRRRFGSVAYYRDEVRQMTAALWWDTARRQVRQAVRALVRAPGFTGAAILTLAVGLGGITAIATIVNSVLLKPLPYPEADRLAAVWLRYTKVDVDRGVHSDASIFTLARFSRTAQSVGAYESREVNLSDPADPERLVGAAVTAGFFKTLGVAPLFGRVITEADDRPGGGSAVVVLGEGFWRRRFGGRPDMVGQNIQIDGVTRQIIGIMPASLSFPEERTQLWVPLGLDPNHAVVVSSTYGAIIRLKPGTTLDAAASDVRQAISRMADLYPDAGMGMTTQNYLSLTGMEGVTRPLRDEVVGNVSNLLWVLAGTAIFVLLVASANVATLFLVRAEARQRELAVRLALGAGRGGVVGQFLTEGLVLAGAGALVGLWLTTVSVRALTRSGAAQLPRLAEVAVDGRILGFLLAVTVIVGVACSLLPLSRLRASSMALTLRSGGRGSTGGRDRQRVRQGLVVAQVALAFALLAGSGLLARTFWGLRSVEPGFNPTNVLTLRVALPAAVYLTASDVARFYYRVEHRLAELPGVRSVGAVSKLPLRPGGESQNAVLQEGATVPQNGVIDMAYASRDYFRTMGIPVLAGQVPERVDPDQTTGEVVVSLSLARREWGDPTGRAAVGRRVRFAPTMPLMTVVGVVGDVRTASLDQAPHPAIYLTTNSIWPPYLASQGIDAAPRSMSVVIAGSADPRALAPAITAAIRTLDPLLPVFDVRPMREVLTTSLARTTFTGWMLGAAAGIALLLGVIGVYGVVAYTVSLRAREIGLRLALGASPGMVGAMMVRQGMRLVAVGIGVGLGLTILITGFLRTLLFGVSRNDPVTLIAVALVLGGATLVATWIPARRAGRLDPALTLVGE